MTSLAERLALTLGALPPMEARLRLSLEDDARWFPVTVEALGDGDVGGLRARDAFLQRFQQTGDHLLRKLFPRLLAAIEASAEPLPFVDMLERLHRFGLLDDPVDWGTLSELRNRLVHDYALEQGELAQDLNLAWAMSPVILAQIARIRTYAIDHHLVSEGRSQ